MDKDSEIIKLRAYQWVWEMYGRDAMDGIICAAFVSVFLPSSGEVAVTDRA